MAEKCPNPRLDCPYFGTKTCVITKHHQYWPRSSYKTKLEHHFRNLPENIEPLSRCDHDDLHEYSFSPKKPSSGQMQRAIAESAMAQVVEPVIPHPPILNVYELDEYRD